MKTNVILGTADIAVLAVIGVLFVAGIYIVIGFFKNK